MADAPKLGNAYVQIVPKAEGIQNQIQTMLDAPATQAGNSAGSKLSAGLKRAVSGLGSVFTNVAAGGAAAIAGISAAVTQTALRGGISRAIGLDDARAKFRQLGMDVDGMMASVDESVTGTRYSMDQAASVAVNFGSAGIKAGKDMTNALKSVASVASISGRDFQDIGTIYTKVASQGKPTGETLNQLAENGVNANAALQKSLGKSKEEISAMVSSGQIDFETFSNAMREYFGDASESANSTFSGALANVRANLGRLGAAFASPALEGLRTIFAGTSEDTVGLIGAIKSLITYLDPVIQKFTKISELVGSQIADSFNAFATTLDNTGSALEAIKAFFMELIPDSLAQKIQELPPSMQSLLGVLAKIGGAIAGVAAGWGVFSGAITMLAPGLARLLGPLLSMGGGFTLIRTALTALTGPIGLVVAAFGLMFARSEQFRTAIFGLVQGIGTALVPIFRTIAGVVAQLLPIISRLALEIGDALAPVIQALIPVIQRGLAILNRVIQVVMAIAIPVIRTAARIVGALAPVFGKVAAAVIGFVSKVRSGFAAIKNAIARPIRTAIGVIQSFKNTVSKIFPLKLGKIFSGSFKLPHIKITSKGKAPWGFGGFGKKPTWKIDWYAQGGIMDGPTLFGGGEKGPEGIVPLDPFWNRLDTMADSIVSGVATVQAAAAGNGQPVQINLYAFPGGPEMDAWVVDTYDRGKRRIG